MDKNLRLATLIVTLATVVVFTAYGLLTASVTGNPVPRYTRHSMPSVALVALDKNDPSNFAEHLSRYVEVVNGCGPYFGGDCVNVRSGPGFEYGVVTQLRNGVVLKVGESVWKDGHAWYKIIFDEWLRYPNRSNGNWYVASDYVRTFLNDGNHEIDESAENNSLSDKYIIVDRSEQMLYAYDGDGLFMKEQISTGIELTPTPRGTFTIYRKTPSRYMQGPLPGISTKYYDLPGVPWNLYFTLEGGVIHGAYWHDKFGQPWSNGCVNLPPEKAKKLYEWANVGTKVIVQD